MRFQRLQAMVLLAAVWICMAGWAEAAERISADELESLMQGGKLVVIDVRTIRDWKSSQLKIKGAIREDPQEVKEWARKYSKDDIIVLYCS